MKDLYRSLSEYPAEMLAGVARAWHVDLPKAEPRDQATTLAEAMLAPGALEAQISSLSPAAREALATLVGEGGVLPGHRLALRYGAMRRLGPSRLAREEPWARPANAVEELYYRGFIVRTYATIGEHYGEVFAVPGNIFRKKSMGTNKLIQQGAKPVLSVEDILEELNLTMVSQQAEVRAIVPENETEAALLEYITSEPVHVDEIRQKSGLPIAQVSSTLALMELKGMVRQVGGMNYVLAREGRVEYVVD